MLNSMSYRFSVWKKWQVATTTNNFHVANMLGRGGFGPVYWVMLDLLSSLVPLQIKPVCTHSFLCFFFFFLGKGKLHDGQEIAVKRLSRTSGRGLEEFMNEVALISKLQHRNLARLLGYCIEGEEKMLIYEYIPNKILDAIVFG